MNTTAKRVVILGATSAIGEATARLYAARGASILLVGRAAERIEAIAADLRARGASVVHCQTIDLAEPAGPSMLPAMAERLGGVDDVLLFYGVLGSQTRAETDLTYAIGTLQTNFVSAAAWCLAAAKLLQDQGHGALVVVGSVAGDRGRQSNYVYGAAKAGLATLVQGIAHRFALQPGGKSGRLRAVVVKPGFVDTPMTAGMKKGGPLWAAPIRVARIVEKAAERGGPIVYAPFFWRSIMLVIRTVPWAVFRKSKL